MHRRRSTAALVAAVTAVPGLWAGQAARAAARPAPAAPAAPSARAVRAAPAVPAVPVAPSTPSVPFGSSTPDDGRLDVLFVGAHPDDEAATLSTLGQWHEYHGVRAGILTVTRGEGGGNAVGPEEGPSLGMLREAEERRAVGAAGITDVHYLDRVDFYYTLSAPLTARVWGHRAALGQVVRIVRETRPKVVVTMDPAPVPGQHGNHQEAGRLAVEAFHAAADPAAFPEQVTREHLAPWRVARIFVAGAAGRARAGPDCAATFEPADPTRDVFGVWSGRPSATGGGRSWAQLERGAQRQYASQGWAALPDVPTDPTRLGCDMFAQVDSRVPFTAGDTAPDAMLRGALVPARGGLPLGTEFWLDPAAFGVSAGVPFTVTAHVRAAGGRRLTAATVRLSTPGGWRVDGDGRVGSVSASGGTATFTLTPPAGAARGRVRLSGTLRAAEGAGTTDRAVEVRGPVVATAQLLPQVSDFETWARRAGVPALSGSVTPVLTLGSGGSRDVRIDLANASAREQSGTVTLGLPAGFATDPTTVPFGPVPPGGTGRVTFRVTNTDPSPPGSDAGGTVGDRPYTVTTTAGATTDTRTGALELVPVTAVPQTARAPVVDGVAGPGEYTGPALDLSRRWEGDTCASAADCSATAKVTRSGDDLYALVHVTDDLPGARLAAADCRRHWRTDSVEIALDPRGRSENTSTTFKTGILPWTAEGGPCLERDADNHQGPGPDTAPGVRVAATVSEPYTGYTVEVRIPLADLPAAVDPHRFAMDVLVYDSDTQDRTGQTRIGWSAWGGVQGDPYRWGLATLPGYRPPADRPVEPAEPVIPQAAARSVDSPRSVLQAAATGVPLAGGPAAPPTDTAVLAGPARSSPGTAVRGVLAASGPGTAHAFVWDAARGVLGSGEVSVDRAGLVPLRVPTAAEPGAGAVLAVAFTAAAGGTRSSTATLAGPVPFLGSPPRRRFRHGVLAGRSYGVRGACGGRS